jgi:hypothetical protein
MLGTFGGQAIFLKYQKWIKLLGSPSPNDFYCRPASASGQ